LDVKDDFFQRKSAKKAQKIRFLSPASDNIPGLI